MATGVGPTTRRSACGPFVGRDPPAREMTSEGYSPMLVLSRKKNESIVINNDIIITVVEIRGDKVRLGIVAPKDVPVHRQEVYEAIHGHRPEGAPSAVIVNQDPNGRV